MYKTSYSRVPAECYSFEWKCCLKVVATGVKIVLGTTYVVKRCNVYGSITGRSQEASESTVFMFLRRVHNAENLS